MKNAQNTVGNYLGPESAEPPLGVHARFAAGLVVEACAPSDDSKIKSDDQGYEGVLDLHHYCPGPMPGTREVL